MFAVSPGGRSKRKKPRFRRKSKIFYAKQQARKKAKGERRNWPLAYMQRNDTLRVIGFASYSDYLASATWAAIREKVLRRDGHRCHGCNKQAFQVHHKSYGRDVLLGVNLTQLVAICRNCHQQIEVDQRGNKLSLDATNARLQAIRSRRTYTASA